MKFDTFRLRALALAVALCLLLPACGGPGGSSIVPPPGAGSASVPGDTSEPIPADISEPPAPSDEVKTEFTTEEFLADYDQLWEELELNYPFLPVLEAKGIDLDGLRESRRRTIESRVTSLEGFVYNLDDLFWWMDRNFAHLSLFSPDLMEQCLIYGRESVQFWYDQMCAPQTVATYSYLGVDYSAVTDSGEELSTLDISGYPEVETRYLPEAKAVYFHFRTFNAAVLERDRTVIQNYLDSLGDVEIEHVILDITGNGGGSDYYWMDNIVDVLGGISLWEHRVFFRETPVNQVFLTPYRQYQPISQLPEGETVPDFVAELGLTHFYTTAWSFDQEDRLPGARRWLLVDGGVYSAADQFATFCRDTGWATVVGRSTWGDGVGPTPVWIVLKNTGLLVRFSSTAAANSDGQLNVLYGTNPDILSPEGESPLETCLRVIAGQEPFKEAPAP